MTSRNLWLILLVALIAFVAGYSLKGCQYQDICLDMGGGISPENYDICVIEQP